MKIDINSIGYRWKGIYSPYLSYIDGDVVYQNGSVLVYRGGTLQNFALGQQDALLAGQLLNGGVSVGGSWGQVLHSNAASGVEFRFEAERGGTIATALMDTYNGIGCYANDHYMQTLMNEGMVRTWGRSISGTLGTGRPDDISYNKPGRVAFPSDAPRVVSIKSGWNVVFYIMSDGSLWVTGTASENINGLGTGTNQLIPTKLSGKGDLGLNTVVTKVFTAFDYYGMQRAGCIDSNGYVYFWGVNNYGCCGWGNTTASPTPKIVPWSITNPCKDVWMSAGQYAATMFVTLDGRAYMAGEVNSTGLGQGDRYIPTRFAPWDSEDPVKKFGSSESLGHWSPGSYYRDWGVLLENGDLYLWGDDGGQVGGGWGDGTTGDNYPGTAGYPKLCLTGVRDFWTRSGGYHSTVALMNDGTVKATGAGGTNGYAVDTTTWATIGGSYLTNVTKIRGLGGLYWGSIMALRSDGRCVGWGNNDDGHLAIGNAVSPDWAVPSTWDFVRLNKTIVDFQLSGACYGGVADVTVHYLCSDGSVYASGVGTYGQTGSRTDDVRYAPNQIIF
jgi:hypothetical protein